MAENILTKNSLKHQPFQSMPPPPTLGINSVSRSEHLRHPPPSWEGRKNNHTKRHPKVKSTIEQSQNNGKSAAFDRLNDQRAPQQV